MPVIAFWDGKSVKDHLVKETILIVNKSGRCEPYGGKVCFFVILQALLWPLQEKPVKKVLKFRVIL